MEIAIPAIALGALYIISNQEKCRTQENLSGYNLGNSQTYPEPTNKQLHNDINRYTNPNQGTDKYFDGGAPNRFSPKNCVEGKDCGEEGFKSLTGEMIQQKDFKHRNMKPFFGSSIKGNSSKYDGNESLLDRMTGAGSQSIKRGEAAPLFKPRKDVEWGVGMPNQCDFIQKQYHPTSKFMNNTKPFESELVGPGLNVRGGAEGTGGFNSGMVARDKWMPKPAVTQRMTTHQGHIIGPKSHVTQSSNPDKMGKMEKNRPDTFYINSPDRYFTTTGLEKAQRGRAVQVFRPENRTSTTSEFFGPGKHENEAATLRSKYRQSTKIIGKPFQPTPAYSPGKEETNVGRDGYKAKRNERSLTEARSEKWGSAKSMVSALMAPISEFLRPSRKENVIGNTRAVGNPSYSEQYPAWDPSDRAKTTMKETTIDNKFPMYINNQGDLGDGGYKVTAYQPVRNQRDTTNYSHYNNAGNTQASANARLYNAEYNTHTSPVVDAKEKLLVSKEPYGNMKLVNNAQTISGRKNDCDRLNNRMFVPQNILKSSGTAETSGCMTGRKNLPSVICERNSPEVLNAFNSNPYTKSLNSVA
tara:strand:+ start:3070 stop:4818 length:1749 start_codon:yes stop_codon:yes gene_type:complete